MKNLGYSIPFPFLWIRQLLQRFGRWIAYKLEDTNQKEGKRNSIAVLDGVRAIAILMVIVFHINRITGDSLWNQVANPLASSVATAGGTGVTFIILPDSSGNIGGVSIAGNANVTLCPPNTKTNAGGAVIPKGLLF